MKKMMTDPVVGDVLVPEVCDDDSVLAISEPTRLVEDLVQSYIRGDYNRFDVVRDIIKSGDEEKIALIFNRIDELRSQIDNVDQASSWLVADILFELYEYFRENAPILQQQDIIEELLHFVGPNSFLSVSETTIYKYIEVARRYPPDKRAGLSFRSCMDSIDIARHAIRISSSRSVSSGEPIPDRDDLMERVPDIVRRVADSGGNKSEISDAILREIGGLSFPFVVQEPSHHRPIFAVDVPVELMEHMPIMGTHSLIGLLKKIKTSLKNLKNGLRADIAISVEDDDRVDLVCISGKIVLDTSGSFIVFEVGNITRTEETRG